MFVLLFDDGQNNVGRASARSIDALRRDNVIHRFCGVNIWNELLRIAIDERKPRGLHLDHDAVSFEEHVIVTPKRDREFCGLIGFERTRMFVAAAIQRNSSMYSSPSETSTPSMKISHPGRAASSGTMRIRFFLGIRLPYRGRRKESGQSPPLSQCAIGRDTTDRQRCS